MMPSTQFHCYLFEAKSIQSYLFQSGKLKDVIAASERLDQIIDSGVDDQNNPAPSVLSSVLKTAKLESDIHFTFTPDCQAMAKNNVLDIRFLRCKGGAFYCYSNSKSAVETLRSLWTLTINQLFPSLEYTDALTSGHSLADGMDRAFAELAASRNKPQVKLPLSLTTFERYQRTGKCAVPLTPLAIRARHEKELDDNSLDIDVERHRQAYQSLNMRFAAALQNKFTPENIDITYPIDFEKHFEFQPPITTLSAEQQEAVKDIALIHIDGNGMGLLLMALKDHLKELEDEKYLRGFRTFSDALSKATIKAARTATLELYQTVKRELQGEPQGSLLLPMRPIVLGGDDITLYCRADLALQYSETFCKAFKTISEQELAPIFAEFLSADKLHPYITASGGILYHKASHPFTQSHHLVELLAQKAKQLTKGVYGADNKTKVGPAALAFYRVSNATQTSFDGLIQNTQTQVMRSGERLSLGLNAYFVEDEQLNGKDTSTQSLETLKRVLHSSNVSINRWRKMATHMAQGDLSEATSIFERGLTLAKRTTHEPDHTDTPNSIKQLHKLSHHSHTFRDFYWLTDDCQPPHYQTIISDLLILEHYQPVSCCHLTEEKECANV